MKHINNIMDCNSTSNVKRCIDCGCILIPEVNWTKGNIKYCIYICKKCVSKRSAIWHQKNKEKEKILHKKWYQEHKDEQIEYEKKKHFNLKIEVIEHYGGRCACCGETNIKYLTIDHINGDGAEHRRKINSKAGSKFYKWLKDNNYPEGFRVLCFNCNCGKKNYSICPHNKEEFKKIQEEKNHNNAQRKYTQKLRLTVIEGYGGKCEICGEDNPYFLTIHHKFNDGNIERKKMAWKKLYRKLRDEGFPRDRYQLLCWNCNCSEEYYD